MKLVKTEVSEGVSLVEKKRKNPPPEQNHAYQAWQLEGGVSKETERESKK